MKKKEQKNTDSKKKDTVSSLKTEPAQTNPVHKGYNEKNPSQPQGAFKPDSKNR